MKVSFKRLIASLHRSHLHLVTFVKSTGCPESTFKIRLVCFVGFWQKIKWSLFTLFHFQLLTVLPLTSLRASCIIIMFWGFSKALTFSLSLTHTDTFPVSPLCIRLQWLVPRFKGLGMKRSLPLQTPFHWECFIFRLLCSFFLSQVPVCVEGFCFLPGGTAASHTCSSSIRSTL